MLALFERSRWIGRAPRRWPFARLFGSVGRISTWSASMDRLVRDGFEEPASAGARSLARLWGSLYPRAPEEHLDPDTLEKILRIAVPVVIVAVVGAVVSYFRGRRGRRRIVEGLNARGATLASDKSALRWPVSPAALAACGKITWSAHLPKVEIGIYGGASGLAAAAVSWQSSRAAGEWMLTSAGGVSGKVKKLGWVEVGEQPLGLIARAQIMTPAGGARPSLPAELALGIKESIGPKRDFALHASGGVLHLVIMDPAELDEPLEFWIGATGAVDRGLASAAGGDVAGHAS